MATTKQTSTTPRTPNYFSNLKSVPNANINVFSAVNQGAKGTGINLAPKDESKDLEKIRNEQIVANNLENIPQINWSAFPDLPNHIKEKIMPKVTNAGAERGYLLHLTKNMGATDFIGKAGVTEKIGLNEDLMLNKIPNELKLLQAKFEGFNEDMYNGNVSDLIDDKEQRFISDLVSGKVPMELDENGNFFFMKDGVPTRTKDLGSYTNTNYEAGGEFVTAFTNAFNKGEKLTKNQEALMRNNFVQKANKYSDGDLMSAAFEDVMKMGGPLLDRTQEPYATMLADMKGIDPRKKMEARQNLELALEDAYMAKLNEQANLGFDAARTGDDGNPITPKKVDLDSWYTGFATDDNPNGVPSLQDWRLQLENTPGKKGTKWEEGFDIINRGGDEATGPTFTSEAYGLKGRTFTQKQLVEDILGTTTAEFNKLTSDERAKLFKKYKINTKQGAPAGKSKTYVVPRSMASTSAQNKIDSGYEIDLNNKEQVFKIINGLR